MANFEDELKRFESIIKKLSDFFLLGKKIVIKGRENFIKKGPNIIIGNHIGTVKDVATLLKIVPRPIFFTANRMIFEKKEFSNLIRRHLHRNLKNLGDFVDFILAPIKSLFVSIISSNISKVGTIPVDMDNGKRLAFDKCRDYLRKGRAIIALQGRGHVIKKSSNPYVANFKRGTSILSYNLHIEEGIDVPVTPVAMLGTHIPFMVPGKIKVNVGRPMYVADYLGGGFMKSVECFRDALEQKVTALLYEILSW